MQPTETADREIKLATTFDACPFCDEVVSRNAVICRSCNRALPKGDLSVAKAAIQQDRSLLAGDIDVIETKMNELVALQNRKRLDEQDRALDQIAREQEGIRAQERQVREQREQRLAAMNPLTRSMYERRVGIAIVIGLVLLFVGSVKWIHQQQIVASKASHLARALEKEERIRQTKHAHVMHMCKALEEVGLHVDFVYNLEEWSPIKDAQVLKGLREDPAIRSVVSTRTLTKLQKLETLLREDSRYANHKRPDRPSVLVALLNPC